MKGIDLTISFLQNMIEGVISQERVCLKSMLSPNGKPKDIRIALYLGAYITFKSYTNGHNLGF